MAVKNEREYRTIALTEFRASEEPDSYVVEGYATTFDDPYVLWEYDGVEYKEQIDKGAFSDADMKDVVFLYNHDGMVFARTRNKSVELSIDDHGLKVKADLGLTSAAREMYETIKAGLVDAMSWAFTIRKEKYDKDKHLRTITKVKKVYDVSAVSFPANPATEISARSFVDGVINEEKAERLDLAKKRLRLKTKM